jgi:hypothetical protein
MAVRKHGGNTGGDGDDLVIVRLRRHLEFLGLTPDLLTYPLPEMSG